MRGGSQRTCCIRDDTPAAAGRDCLAVASRSVAEGKEANRCRKVRGRIDEADQGQGTNDNSRSHSVGKAKLRSTETALRGGRGLLP
jgi:hypothetical protein